MQEKNRRFKKLKNFVLGHLIANGYTYFELAEAISTNDTENVKSLLVKLFIYTVSQLALKHLKSGKRGNANDHQ
jgi:hypothetical protein